MDQFSLKFAEIRSWNLDQWKANIATHYEDFSDSRRDIEPANLFEDAWQTLLTYTGDLYLIVVFYCFMNTFYFLGGAFFWFCDRYQLLHNYKIQVEKYPDTTEYIRCALNLFQNYILVIFPIIFITFPLFRMLGFKTSLPFPDIQTFTLHFIFQVIVEDVAHYCLHRLLHTPWLYKNIHKVHHQFSTPFGLAAAYAHPAEVLILGFCTFLGALIIGPHMFTFLSWVLYRQLDAVGTHCGYDLPNIMNLVPFYGGTASHDYHHKSFIFNYSSRFTFMDHLCGTHKEPIHPGKKENPSQVKPTK